MICLRSKYLFLASYFYLLIPLAIFLCGWVIAWVGIPLTILLGVAPFMLSKGINSASPPIPRKGLLIAVAVIFIWILLSGIGGYLWQNRWDHLFRNALFLDLVNRNWPVSSGPDIISYYFGFWLPSALIAKLFGSVALGRAAQFIYAFLGLLIAFGITIEKTGSFKIYYLIPFIFFSGIDIIAFPLSGAELLSNFHIELWSELAAWQSNTTLIFWVYNQAIPAWVATMMILNFSNLRGAPALILSLLCISAPFAVVGLFPLACFYICRDAYRAGSFINAAMRLFNPCNVLALLGSIPVIIFFSLNQTQGIRIYFWNLSVAEWLWQLILLLCAELLVFIPFIYRQIRRSPEFYILLVTNVVGLIFVMGDTGDFNSRIELPLNFFLALQLTIFISRWQHIKLGIRRWFLIVAALAVVTPAIEIARTIAMSILKPASEYQSLSVDTIFEVPELRSNFVADSALNNPDNDTRLRLFRFQTSDHTHSAIEIIN